MRSACRVKDRPCKDDDATCRWCHTENQTHSPFGSRVRETAVSASSILTGSQQSGKACASAPDWANHPCLKNIPSHDRRAFRELKITEWLDGQVSRMPNEGFCSYLLRCIATAEQELRLQKKLHIGDDYIHNLDKLV